MIARLAILAALWVTPVAAAPCLDEENFAKLMGRYENRIVGTGVVIGGQTLLFVIVDKDRDWFVFIQQAGTKVRCLLTGGQNWDDTKSDIVVPSVPL